MAEDAKRELERVQEKLQADHEATDDAGVAYAAGLDESSTERTETLVKHIAEKFLAAAPQRELEVEYLLYD